MQRIREKFRENFKGKGLRQLQSATHCQVKIVDPVYVSHKPKLYPFLLLTWLSLHINNTILKPNRFFAIHIQFNNSIVVILNQSLHGRNILDSIGASTCTYVYPSRSLCMCTRTSMFLSQCSFRLKRGGGLILDSNKLCLKLKFEQLKLYIVNAGSAKFNANEVSVTQTPDLVPFLDIKTKKNNCSIIPVPHFLKSKSLDFYQLTRSVKF